MKNKIIILVTASLLIGVSSCRKGCTDPIAENYDARAKKNDNSCTYIVAETTSKVNLSITHKSGTSSFAFNTDYTDGFGNKYQFTRAQMYLSNPVYKDDNGDVIVAPKEYALVSPATTSYAFGELPGDTHIHTMDIAVGIDSIANASTSAYDPSNYEEGHPLSNQTPTMFWTWSSGYIFMTIEGVVDIDGNGTYDAGETFVYHVGKNSNFRVNEGLMAHFMTVTGQTHNIDLVLDWSKLFDGIDMSVDHSTHTMDNMALATRVADNAKNVLSIP